MRFLRLVPFSSLVVVLLSMGLAAPASANRDPACGDTLTVSTTLDADLNCTGDGLNIGASHMTLNLGGHTLSFVGSGGSVGVRADGFSNLVIQNGTIRGFSTGVSLNSVDASVVRGLTISESSDWGVHLNGSSSNRIEANVVADNGNGIGLATGSHRNKIIRNEVSGADGGGIAAENTSDRNQISANRISGALEAIVLQSGSDYNNVNRNTIIDSGSTGVNILTNSDGNKLFKNTIYGHGIAVQNGSDDTRVIRNMVEGSPLAAVNVLHSLRTKILGNTFVDGARGVMVQAESRDAVVRGNTITGSTIFGILILNDADGARVARNTLTDNTLGIELWGVSDILVAGNEITGSTDGVRVASNVEGLTLRYNTSNGNSDDGIDVDTTAATINWNTANDNGDLGIEALDGVTGQGNTASGNGNPLQCTGVPCS